MTATDTPTNEQATPTDEQAGFATGVPFHSTGGASDADNGRTFTVTGQDWDSIADGLMGADEERVIVNMGPQHPSTHGVLRLILELDGETVRDTRAGIGYLHTGIEKNMEFRSWTQGVTFVTRADYLAPLFNEAAYCGAVEKLLNISDQVPRRALDIRIMLMELNRIASHLVAIATGGMEIGALTVMTIGFRDREKILDVFEHITGLRMNHAYFRPGGVSTDLPGEGLDKVRECIAWLEEYLPEYADLCNENPIFKGRLQKVGYLDLSGCLALGATGPVIRATGYPLDLRKSQPYWGYDTYDFEVCTQDSKDAYGRFLIRLAEMWESLKIVRQAVDRLEKSVGEPIMVDDRKIAWPAQLAVSSDGQGNSLAHIRHIMGESMEALIHHFKLVTEGFRVPPGQVYFAIESPRGELGCHAVSDGGTRPYRVHLRDPSFVNLQSAAAMCEGAMISDVIVAVASIDPVMGGVDR